MPSACWGASGIGKAAKDTLRAHTLRGSIITIADFGFRQCLGLFSNLLLAWLLFPEAFVLMALVAVILRGLKMFSDVGIGPSIVQHERGDDPAFLNTAWTLQIIRGVALWVGASVLAWPASTLYGAPDLWYVLPIAAFSSVIAGLKLDGLLHALPRSLTWAPMVILGWRRRWPA